MDLTSEGDTSIVSDVYVYAKWNNRNISDTLHQWILDHLCCPFLYCPDSGFYYPSCCYSKRISSQPFGSPPSFYVCGVSPDNLNNNKNVIFKYNHSSSFFCTYNRYHFMLLLDSNTLFTGLVTHNYGNFSFCVNLLKTIVTSLLRFSKTSKINDRLSKDLSCLMTVMIFHDGFCYPLATNWQVIEDGMQSLIHVISSNLKSFLRDFSPTSNFSRDYLSDMISSGIAMCKFISSACPLLTIISDFQFKLPSNETVFNLRSHILHSDMPVSFFFLHDTDSLFDINDSDAVMNISMTLSMSCHGVAVKLVKNKPIESGFLFKMISQLLCFPVRSITTPSDKSHIESRTICSGLIEAHMVDTLSSRLKLGYQLNYLAHVPDQSTPNKTENLSRYLLLDFTYCISFDITIHTLMLGLWRGCACSEGFDNIVTKFPGSDKNFFSIYNHLIEDWVKDSVIMLTRSGVCANMVFIELDEKVNNLFTNSMKLKIRNHLTEIFSNDERIQHADYFYNHPELLSVFRNQNPFSSHEINNQLATRAKRSRRLRRQINFFFDYWRFFSQASFFDRHVNWISKQGIYCILEHDPLPMKLAFPFMLNSRVVPLNCRQSLSIVKKFLSEWCTLSIPDASSYVGFVFPRIDNPKVFDDYKLLHSKYPFHDSAKLKAKSGPSVQSSLNTSDLRKALFYFVVKIEVVSFELRILLMFAIGTPGNIKDVISTQLIEQLSMLRFTARGHQATPRSRHKTGAPPQLESGEAVPLQRSWEETPCCTTFENNLGELVLDRGTWYNSRVDIRPIQVDSSLIISPHLHHEARVWIIRPMQCQTSVIQYILSSLLHVRIQEGFHVNRVGSFSKFISLVTEIKMSSQTNPTSSDPAMIQYQIYLLNDSIWNIDSTTSCDDDIGPTNATLRQAICDLNSNMEDNTRLLFDKASDPIFIVTETWIQPIHGRLTNTRNSHWLNANFIDLSSCILHRDKLCIMPYVTFDYLVSVRSNTTIRLPFIEAAGYIRLFSTFNQTEPAGRIEHAAPDLLQLLSLSPQFIVLFPLLNNDISNSSEEPTSSLNDLLINSLVVKLGSMQNVFSINLTNHQSHLFLFNLISQSRLDPPSSHSQDSVAWSCFVLRSSSHQDDSSVSFQVNSDASLTIILFPKSFQDVCSDHVKRLIESQFLIDASDNKPYLPVYIFTCSRNYLSSIIDDCWTYKPPSVSLFDFRHIDQIVTSLLTPSPLDRSQFDSLWTMTAPVEFLSVALENFLLTKELNMLWCRVMTSLSNLTVLLSGLLSLMVFDRIQPVCNEDHATPSIHFDDLSLLFNTKNDGFFPLSLDVTSFIILRACNRASTLVTSVGYEAYGHQQVAENINYDFNDLFEHSLGCRSANIDHLAYQFILDYNRSSSSTVCTCLDHLAKLVGQCLQPIDRRLAGKYKITTPFGQSLLDSIGSDSVKSTIHRAALVKTLTNWVIKACSQPANFATKCPLFIDMHLVINYNGTNHSVNLIQPNHSCLVTAILSSTELTSINLSNLRVTLQLLLVPKVSPTLLPKSRLDQPLYNSYPMPFDLSPVDCSLPLEGSVDALRHWSDQIVASASCLSPDQPYQLCLLLLRLVWTLESELVSKLRTLCLPVPATLRFSLRHIYDTDLLVTTLPSLFNHTNVDSIVHRIELKLAAFAPDFYRSLIDYFSCLDYSFLASASCPPGQLCDVGGFHFLALAVGNQIDRCANNFNSERLKQVIVDKLSTMVKDPIKCLVSKDASPNTIVDCSNLPPFWLLFRISTTSITLFLHQNNFYHSNNGVYSIFLYTIACIHCIVKLVNQKILLRQLREKRIFNDLLMPPSQELQDHWTKTGTPIGQWIDIEQSNHRAALAGSLSSRRITECPLAVSFSKRRIKPSLLACPLRRRVYLQLHPRTLRYPIVKSSSPSGAKITVKLGAHSEKTQDQVIPIIRISGLENMSVSNQPEMFFLIDDQPKKLSTMDDETYQLGDESIYFVILRELHTEPLSSSFPHELITGATAITSNSNVISWSGQTYLQIDFYGMTPLSASTGQSFLQAVLQCLDELVNRTFAGQVLRNNTLHLNRDDLLFLSNSGRQVKRSLHLPWTILQLASPQSHRCLQSACHVFGVYLMQNMTLTSTLVKVDRTESTDHEDSSHNLSWSELFLFNASKQSQSVVAIRLNLDLVGDKIDDEFDQREPTLAMACESIAEFQQSANHDRSGLYLTASFSQYLGTDLTTVFNTVKCAARQTLSDFVTEFLILSIPTIVSSTSFRDCSTVNQSPVSRYSEILNPLVLSKMTPWFSDMSSSSSPTVNSRAFRLQLTLDLSELLDQLRLALLPQPAPATSVRRTVSSRSNKSIANSPLTATGGLLHRLVFEPSDVDFFHTTTDTNVNENGQQLQLDRVTLTELEDRLSCLSPNRFHHVVLTLLRSSQVDSQSNQQFKASPLGRLKLTPWSRQVDYCPNLLDPVTSSKVVANDGNSLDEVPRRSFCLLKVKRCDLELLAYNWTDEDFNLLAQMLASMTNWFNNRRRILVSIALQKLGLYHHPSDPVTRRCMAWSPTLVASSIDHASSKCEDCAEQEESSSAPSIMVAAFDAAKSSNNQTSPPPPIIQSEQESRRFVDAFLRLYQDCSQIPSLATVSLSSMVAIGSDAAPNTSSLNGSSSPSPASQHINQAFALLHRDSRQAYHLDHVVVPFQAWLLGNGTPSTLVRPVAPTKIVNADLTSMSKTMISNRPMTLAPSSAAAASASNNSAGSTIGRKANATLASDPPYKRLKRYSAARLSCRHLYSICTPILFTTSTRHIAADLARLESDLLQLVAEAHYSRQCRLRSSTAIDQPLIDGSSASSLLSCKSPSDSCLIWLRQSPSNERQRYWSTTDDNSWQSHQLTTKELRQLIRDYLMAKRSRSPPPSSRCQSVDDDLGRRQRNASSSNQPQLNKSASSSADSKSTDHSKSVDWVRRSQIAFLNHYLVYLQHEVGFNLVKTSSCSSGETSSQQQRRQRRHRRASNVTPRCCDRVEGLYALLYRTFNIPGVYVMEVFVRHSLLYVRLGTIELSRFNRYTTRALMTGPRLGDLLVRAAASAAASLVATPPTPSSPMTLASTFDPASTRPRRQRRRDISWDESSRLCDNTHINSFSFDFHLLACQDYLYRQLNPIKFTFPVTRTHRLPLGQLSAHLPTHVALKTGHCCLTCSTDVIEEERFEVASFLSDLSSIFPRAPLFSHCFLLPQPIRLPIDVKDVLPARVYRQLIQQPHSPGVQVVAMSSSINKRRSSTPTSNQPSDQLNSPVPDYQFSSLSFYPVLGSNNNYDDFTYGLILPYSIVDSNSKSTSSSAQLVMASQSIPPLPGKSTSSSSPPTTSPSTMMITDNNNKPASIAIIQPDILDQAGSVGPLTPTTTLPVGGDGEEEEVDLCLTTESHAACGLLVRDHDFDTGRRRDPSCSSQSEVEMTLFLLVSDPKSLFPRAKLTPGLVEERRSRMAPTEWPAISPSPEIDDQLVQHLLTSLGSGNHDSHQSASTLFDSTNQRRRLLVSDNAIFGQSSLSSQLNRLANNRPRLSLATFSIDRPLSPLANSGSGDLLPNWVKWHVSYSTGWPQHQARLLRLARKAQAKLESRVRYCLACALVYCHKQLMWYKLFDKLRYPSSTGTLVNDDDNSVCDLRHRGITFAQLEELELSAPLKLDLLAVDSRLATLLSLQPWIAASLDEHLEACARIFNREYAAAMSSETANQTCLIIGCLFNEHDDDDVHASRSCRRRYLTLTTPAYTDGTVLLSWRQQQRSRADNHASDQSSDLDLRMLAVFQFARGPLQSITRDMDQDKHALEYFFKQSLLDMIVKRFVETLAYCLWTRVATSSDGQWKR